MNKCKDGKRHLWRSGWCCAKCGIMRVDYEEEKKKTKEERNESNP